MTKCRTRDRRGFGGIVAIAVAVFLVVPFPQTGAQFSLRDITSQESFDAMVRVASPEQALEFAIYCPFWAVSHLDLWALITAPAGARTMPEEGGVMRGGGVPAGSIMSSRIRPGNQSVTLEVEWAEDYPMPGDAVDVFGTDDLTGGWQRILERPLSGTELALRRCEITIDLSDLGWTQSGFFRVANKLDSDGDGLSDAYEAWVAGTNPNAWSTVGDAIPDGWKVKYGLDAFDPTLATQKRFGMTILEKYLYGCDPNTDDTDGDGLPDWYELMIGTSPTNPDSDGDGLTDYEEHVIYMTNPLRWDTNGDGLSDGEKIALGLSPFWDDTDGDGLSDYREVKELGSNPLSVDTDGDGIDDYTEYLYRNYGLDLLSPSDAADDYSGDGLSNLFKYTWRWSHITPASTNVLASYKILFVSTGQYPYRSSTLSGEGGASSRIIALGSHPTLSARMRIPTSTPLNHTNVAKRLYFTPVPGIYLDGAPLDSLPEPIVISDSSGNKEYEVTATPDAVGQVASFWLGDDTGKTNTLPLKVTVPKITKAELVVSQNPNSYARTNLVPGVKGVICARSTDLRFGLPRVTISPSIQNDSPYGGPLFVDTDFLLVRASGATNGTWTLNWKRWDSAYNARHGIPVPPGRTRIDIGIDFNFDGELSEEEIALSCDVCVIDGAIVPDYDRNRAIDDADIEAAAAGKEHRWWINDDKDNGDFSTDGSSIPGQSGNNRNCADAVVNGRDDLVDFFPVWLDMAQILASVPEDSGFTYKLRSSYGNFNAVWTSLSRNEAGKFLTEDIGGCGPLLNQNAWEAATTNVLNAGIVIPDAFLNLIRNDPNKGVVLLEARGTGVNDLHLNVCLGNVTKWTTNITFRTSSVESMYNHFNFRPDNAGLSTYTNMPPNCPFPESDKHVVFLHGFHVPAQEARGWNAKMFKKLHQSGSNARFWGTTWQGDQGIFSGGLNYFGNVINAFNMASNLAVRVNAIPGPGAKKTVIAHSLGNMAAARAIQRHGLQTDKLLALNAAIASEAFDDSLYSVDRRSMRHYTWRAYESQTWASEFHALFTGSSDWRRNLTWKNRFPAVRPKLYNFYSTGDEVLEEYTERGRLWGTTGGIRRYAWHKQEHFKGRGGPHGSYYMGWDFELYDHGGGFAPFTPQQANKLSPAQLRGTPVFMCTPSAVLSPTRPPQTTVDIMLAHGIPALSQATGVRNVNTEIEARNFDMDTFRTPNWPNSSDNNRWSDRWLHNDAHSVAYRYAYKLFDKLVDEIKGETK
ncbi:MAG: hypothetical protein FWG50_06785 [Kiritimatiellaeota bacterium]|nr:hypothetical protein [Kiritimatiellota bacterium]